MAAADPGTRRSVVRLTRTRVNQKAGVKGHITVCELPEKLAQAVDRGEG